MEGWANVQRHVAEEITLLCDNHHRERTSGLLPLAAVRAADRDPINRRVGASPPHPLHFAGSTCSASIGGVDFRAASLAEGQALVPIVVDLLPLVMFRLEDGNVLLSLYAFTEDNTPALIIIDNELRFSTGAWDIEFVGRRLTVRQARGAFLLDVVFDVPERVVIERGCFLFNGIRVEVTPNSIRVPNNELFFQGGTIESVGACAGIVLGDEAPAGLAAAWQFGAIQRYPVKTPYRADTGMRNPLLESDLRFFRPERNWPVRQAERIVRKDVRLDGFHWRDCVFDSCFVLVGGTREAFGLSNCKFIGDNKWVFDGAAERTLKWASKILAGGPAPMREAVESLFDAIRRGVNLRPYIGVFGPDPRVSSEALYTAMMLSGFYHGLGPGGMKLVDGLFDSLRRGGLKDRRRQG
jgi:trigger factor